MHRQNTPETPDIIALSIILLAKVLEGTSCVEVSRDYGIHPNTVARRIKVLVRHLQQVTTIQGLSDLDPVSVRHLRLHRKVILDALDTVGPILLAPLWKASATQAYTPRQIQMAVECIDTRSDQPLRDVAMFRLLYAADIHPVEIARLRVRDCLHSNGEVRLPVELSDEHTFNGIARPLRVTDNTVDETIKHYLHLRATRHRLTKGSAFLGLDPEQPLFLADSGNGFTITEYAHQGQRRYLCRSILETYRKIHRLADLSHGTLPIAHTGTVLADHAETDEEE